jgi:hypothetical protein
MSDNGHRERFIIDLGVFRWFAALMRIEKDAPE